MIIADKGLSNVLAFFYDMLDERRAKTISLSGNNFVRQILVPHWMEVLTGILVGISVVHLTIK